MDKSCAYYGQETLETGLVKRALALGYPKEGISLGSKAILQQAVSLFRNRKKLEDVASLEEFGIPFK